MHPAAMMPRRQRMSHFVRDLAQAKRDRERQRGFPVMVLRKRMRERVPLAHDQKRGE